MKKLFFLVFLYFCLLIKAQKQEEKDSLCDRCSCGKKPVPRLVDCSNQEFAELPTTELSELFEQEVTFDVDFSGNSISHLNRFPTLNVHTLSLSKSRIYRIKDQAFKNLTFLTVLDLSHNHLTGDALK